MNPKFYTREEVYEQEPEFRKLFWFIYYELVDACSNAVLIVGLITIWELALRQLFV